jgi:hypothetical protein
MYYEIGEGSLPDRPGWHYGVGYEPSSIDRPIALWEGAGMMASGGSFSAVDALGPQFEENFRIADAEWFLPFVRRLANGELLDLDEVLEAFRERHGRDPRSFG